MNSNNNDNCYNTNSKYSSNEKTFQLQMEKNLTLNWDEFDLNIEKEKKTSISSANARSDHNLNKSSSNNRNDSEKEASSNSFFKNKISLEEVKHFNSSSSDLDLSEELLIAYERNETLSDQQDPAEHDEVYAIDYDSNNYCLGCDSIEDNINDEIIVVRPDQISYDDIEEDSFIKKVNNGRRAKLSPVSFNKSIKSHVKSKIDYPTEEAPVYNTGDDLMKFYAFNTPIGHLARCNPRQCPYGGKCVDEANIKEIMDLKEGFWGKRDDYPAPSTSDRRRKIEAILRASYIQKRSDFEFYTTNRERNNRIVCEAGFLIMLGLMNKPNPSNAPSQWRRMKQFIQKYRGEQGRRYSYNELALDRDPKSDEKEPSRIKFENCVAFITFFVKHNGETVPDATGAMGADQKASLLLVAPFCDILSFHEEYKMQCSESFVIPEEVGCLTVFTSAFKHLHKTEGVRLQSSKGGFNTCEICHNAKELSRNKHKIHKPSMREVIRNFKHLHLSQQSKERRNLDVRKLEAQVTDEFGHPVKALLFADFMTSYTCRTPYSKTTVKGDHFIETRLCGIEVYCGTIKTVFVYRIDSLVDGGANLMVEIVRQALIDLLELLKQRNLRAPRFLGLQFDNCGENKNKEMFGYICVLIEDFIFDFVEVCFLIVGHTHASIDQYFSRIAKAIYTKKTRYIASPLGLLHLIKCCHMRTYEQKPIIRDIVVHYDFVTAIKPYIKKNIRYYSIPHYFILKAIHPRIAIMQHMMFSFNNKLLPPIPSESIISCREELLDKLVESIDVSKSFAIINGKFAVKEKFGFTSSGKVKRKLIDDSANYSKEMTPSAKSHLQTVEKSSAADNEDDDSSIASNLFGNKKKSQDLTTLNELLPSLEELSLESLVQQEKRMSDEAQGKQPKRPSQYKIPYISEIRKVLTKTSTSQSGYIVWLSSKKTISDKTDANRWRDLINPKPFELTEIISHIDLLISAEAVKQKELREASTLPRNNENNKKNFDRSENTEYDEDHEESMDLSSGPFSVRNRRVYKAASDIATTAKWILNQVEMGIIQKNANILDFNDNLTSNFASSTLILKEIEWYEARNTAEKVLRLAQDEYNNAPRWEPLPINSLSPEDLAKIQEAETKYKANVELAEQIGRDALVKLGHDFKDGEQVIAYGKNDLENSVQRISKAFKAVRAKRRQSSSMKKTSETKYYCCDVEECDTVVCSNKNVSCSDEFCSQNVFRKGLRFCPIHLQHDNHLGARKRNKRSRVSNPKFSIISSKTDATATKITKVIIDKTSTSSSNNKKKNESKSNGGTNISSSLNSMKSNESTANNQKRKLSSGATDIANALVNTGEASEKTKKMKLGKVRSMDNTDIATKKNGLDISSEVSSKYNTGAKSRIDRKKLETNDTLPCRLATSGDESKEDKLIKSCLFTFSDAEIYQLLDSLPDNHLFKTNDGLFKLFFKIRNTLASSSFTPTSLIELINFSMYFNNLKILAINVFKIDHQIETLINTNEWREANLAKNKYLKDQFISKFVECFLNKYNKSIK